MLSWFFGSSHSYTKMQDNESAVETTMNLDSSLTSSLSTANQSNNNLYETYEKDSMAVRALTLHDLADPSFYKKENWFENMCEVLFKLSRRGTTIKAEVYFGLIHYISCLYCLAVVPQQLSAAGYGGRNTVVAIALCSGIGSICCGLFANLPFVLAPPTVVSIFLSVFLQQVNQGPQEGSLAVVFSGVVLLFFGWRPLGRLASRLIPVGIQVGTAIGIGLLTSLAGSTEINLVESGSYTIVQMGAITPKICIALSGTILICVATNYHIKGAFCIATVVCSLVWWMYANDWPSSIAGTPQLTTINVYQAETSNTVLLTADLIFLYVLYLNGLMTSLSNMAVLTREDDTIPRGRWIFIVCGIFTILSGLVTSAPILVSPESASSIKAGAKTGLSSVVAGLLFLVSLFFSPLFEDVPSAGTSPILIMIGVILFQNVDRIGWRKLTSAAPAFIVLFYIPFTYSIVQGVIIGYVFYLTITFFSGELLENLADFLKIYFPAAEIWLVGYFPAALERRASQMEHPQGTRSSTSRRIIGVETTATKTTLFDDSASQVGHIVSGDMAMTNIFSTTYASTGNTSGTFADFGTAIRNSTAHHVTNTMHDKGQSSI